MRNTYTIFIVKPLPLGRTWEDDIKTDFRDATQDVIHFMPFVTSLINIRVL